MQEKEFKQIIDREKHKKDARQIFSKQIDLLVDLVNYGSNLIIRAYDSSKKKLEDAIVIGVLLKQVVAMIDATEILLCHGSPQSADIQVRSALEASLYIDWMLKSELEKKAKYYYVSNLRNMRLWALRYLKGTEENQLFLQSVLDLIKYMEPSNVTEEDEDEAKRQVTEIERILSQEGYREINDEFVRMRVKKTGAEAYWYKPLGISSIKKIAEEVGRLSEYIIYYSKGSEFTHIASYREHVKFNQGKVKFEPIRQLEGADTIIQSIIGITLASYQSILKHYRYGELRNFGRKYKNEWRVGFQNIPHVSYVESDDK